MPKKNYDNTSISSLKGADRVRKRPGVIFGSDGIEGCCHSAFEIISNSIDEAREGFGDVIYVRLFEDGAIEVKDEGRGIPLEYNENEGRFNWELVFCELYAGGKYANSEGADYEYSLGTNGLGAAATQYASEWMDVEVVRDGYKYSLHFEKGENVGGLKKEKLTGAPHASGVATAQPASPRNDVGLVGEKGAKTGTTIKWLPDRDVFTDINIPGEYLAEILKKQAVVNKGLKFVFVDEGDSDGGSDEGAPHAMGVASSDTLCPPRNDIGLVKTFYYDNGIVDYLKEMASEKAITPVKYFAAERTGKDREDKAPYKVKMNFAFCFNPEVNILEYYHNSSFLEHGGSPDRAVKSAFTSAMDNLAKNLNKYNKNESKILFADIADCLCLISNSFSTVTSYENQTKKSITNKFIQEAMTEFLKQSLEVYFRENPAEAEKIITQVLINKRSRETAEKTRIAAKKNLTANIDITNRVQKFVNCRSKDLSKREIYIVEGDSALGACKLGRDAEFQAIIPVRGKILNCLKADYAKIFKNDIILDLARVLGCGVEVNSKHNKELNTFDLANLKWDKIIICTDADVDGYQIRTLILTMFYRLMPQLIEEGKIYIAESPLFEIECGKETYFAFDEGEKSQLLKKLEGKKYSLQRSKGLGENQPEMMWETTMNPETRRLVQVLPEDDHTLTQTVFDMLLGDNLEGRKRHIAHNGGKYIELTDVS